MQCVCAAKQKSRKRACTRRQKNLINKTEREEKRKFFGFVSVYYCYYWFVCTHRATAAATAAAKKAANITTRQKCDTVMIRLIGTPFFLLHKRSKREKSIVKIENSERTQTKRNKNEICEYVNDKRSQSRGRANIFLLSKCTPIHKSHRLANYFCIFVRDFPLRYRYSTYNTLCICPIGRPTTHIRIVDTRERQTCSLLICVSVCT